ncbi:MAG TPA: DNA (cytosine-5-)-methyltransferase [Treponemataceae bacterium]|nr:DNA (cytosine-5-)-methyltransferase [Treponemataceae bacterium]
MNVLSLFDGISCGKVALDRAVIKYDKYYASEIDKYAIKIAMKNHPDIIQLGDVRDVKDETLPEIDLLMGGSPCQGFSFAGKQLNFGDPRSQLFFEFVRILKEVKPKYFLLENVKMKKEFQDVITSYLGFEPIEINSALVSAQNRRRLYWTNISDIEQPKDKKIYLKDILEDGIVDRDKSYCIDANYFKGGNLKQYFEKHRRQLVFDREPHNNKFKQTATQSYLSPKHKTLLANAGDKTRGIGIHNEKGFWRKLTPVECERLQTLPDNYTEGISNTQRYKTLGNGWTVDVIAHILSYM